jgi:hypothetical protein
MPVVKIPFIMLAILLLQAGYASAQANTVEVKGIVYDISQRTPMEAVSVMATNGRGTITDSFGRYAIWVRETDSIFFSYQNKATGKYPVLTIQDPNQFNMALHVQVQALAPVTIYGRNYRMDSLSNRMEYAKYFNWSKPNPLKSVNVANGGVGMDPNEIINMFRFKRTRQLTSLRNRLIAEEQEKYVDFRFNRNFVKRVTGLTDAALKKFMYKYRPPYDFLEIVNELELGFYIQQCYKKEMGLLPVGVDIYLLGVQPLEMEARRQ